MCVFCRLSWEEESNVSTGDDNSPGGKCELFLHTKWQLIFARALTLYIRELIFAIGPICFSHWELITRVLYVQLSQNTGEPTST